MCVCVKNVHPRRFPEGPGRISGRKSGRISTGCGTLRAGRFPEGTGRVPEVEPEGCVHFSIFVKPARLTKLIELVPCGFRKETGRYLKATM